MKGLWTIIKKEFSRFFRDKKLIFTMIFPGILIFAIYSVMGTVMNSFIEEETGASFTEMRVLTQNPSDRLEQLVIRNTAHSGYEVEFITTSASEEDAKTQVAEGAYEAYLSLPADFDELVKEDREVVPEVKIFYNSDNTASSVCYSLLTECFRQYEEGLVNRFNVNSGMTNYDLAETDLDEIMEMMYSMLVPFLLIMFVVTGALSITPESIAGEKERGTIATILVTPVKRGFVALGKIISLSVFASLGALSSFLGTMLSLPMLINGSSGGVLEGAGISFNLFELYSVGDIVGLLFIVLSFVPVMVGLLSLISTLSKSVKEATSASSAVMIVSMLVGLSSMFGIDSLWAAFVPILNVAIAISSVLSGTASIGFILATIGMNFVYVGLLSLLLAKLFGSEKIML